MSGDLTPGPLKCEAEMLPIETQSSSVSQSSVMNHTMEAQAAGVKLHTHTHTHTLLP